MTCDANTPFAKRLIEAFDNHQEVEGTDGWFYITSIELKGGIRGQFLEYVAVRSR